MKKNIPKPFKYVLAFLYIFFRTASRGRPAKKIALNLSGVLPPIGSSKIVHGGKVKLLHLREYFGDSWRGFNLAYFASSGLPFAPKLWMKLYKLFGVKVVWNQNGVAYPALYSQDVVKKVNGLMKPIHESDFVIYQTEFTKRCADRFLGEFKGLSQILVNPVDISLFKPRETTLPIEPLVILMLGNHFESEERMTASLEALKLLRERGIELKLIIIGHAKREFEEDWIETTGGFLQKDAPELFRRAHLFLHLKYLDPCPTTVIEALSSGLPVIGSRSGGMPELVDETSGVLVPLPEDFEKLHYPEPKEVAEAILKVRGSLSQFSAAARKRAVENFEKGNWLKKHEEIFDRILA